MVDVYNMTSMKGSSEGTRLHQVSLADYAAVSWLSKPRKTRKEVLLQEMMRLGGLSKRARRRSTGATATVVSLLAAVLFALRRRHSFAVTASGSPSLCWVPSFRRARLDVPCPRSHSAGATTFMHAKRNRRDQSKQDEDYLNRWYDAVDADASPDDIFWEEMERQRLLNQIGNGPIEEATEESSNVESGVAVISGGGRSATSSLSTTRSIKTASTLTRANRAVLATMNSGFAGSTNGMSTITTLDSLSSGLSMNGLNGIGAVSSSSARSGSGNVAGASAVGVDATLAEYAVFAVDDNWLDEELQWMMANDESMVEQMSAPMSLDEQIDDWVGEQKKQRKTKQTGESGGAALDENLEFDDIDEEEEEDSNAWMQSDEPWDHWGESRDDDSLDGYKSERIRIRNKQAAASEFLFLGVDDDEDSSTDDALQRLAELEAAREREAFEERLSQIKITSSRLDKARNSPKAKEFFSREADRQEGYDRLWVSAIDNACFKNLVGVFQNYGIEFADNFGDWQDGSLDDALLYSIEDVASYKARQVFEVTGLPCIASRTSFEIEPVPTKLSTGATGGPGGIGAPAGGRATAVNPRVASGYRFNDVGMHVDYICEALRTVSEPSRVTSFKTCLCYYDGEMEIYDYGVCDVDLLYSNSLRTFIPVSQAINEMIKTLELTFGLEYQQWLKTRSEASKSLGLSPASIRLRDRVLKEGRVLPNDIIDVSAFMDSQVDVNLMDECARDLAERFMDVKPTKILTVATTGLVIALPLARYLQVPCVYARKERNIVMADTFKAGYSSKTVGKNRELLVARSHVHSDDRILIVDDFLSSGSSQEALLRIISEAGATPVGVGVLLEKEYDSGRQSLSGFDIPIHSLCRVTSVKNGVIQLHEEVGYDRM
jgi:xanthine phosphoribosyltransferase